MQLEAPSTVAQNQRAAIQVPQLTMVQLHERFRWPTDHVLLLSMGVVATPGPEKPNPVMDMVPLPKSAPRCGCAVDGRVERDGVAGDAGSRDGRRAGGRDGELAGPDVSWAVLAGRLLRLHRPIGADANRGHRDRRCDQLAQGAHVVQLRAWFFRGCAARRRRPAASADSSLSAHYDVGGRWVFKEPAERSPASIGFCRETRFLAT